MTGKVTGTFCALFTPRRGDGAVNGELLRANSEFLLEAGMDGLVMNGATGEYLHSREEDFAEILEIVSDVAGPGRFIAGIGGTDVNRSIRNGRMAMESGARALLLPAPHFFRYSQDDLIAYVQHVAKAVEAPVLLYNLPQFTNGYETSTVINLLSSMGGSVVGLKDSSGSLETLRAMAQRNQANESCIVGNDQVLVQGRREGISDGVISGVASAMPELILYLNTADMAAEPERYAAASALLDELIGQLGPFPVPWGLKFIAERRGLGPMGSVIPVSASRRSQVVQLTAWLEEWWERASNIIPVDSLEVAKHVS
jgi:4-hydroxy-tetrahydrodipicolinate synthase